MGRIAFLTFTIFSVCVIAGCTALGIWQLQRHHWKAGLRAEAAARASAAPVAFPASAESLPAYRPFEITGQFLEGYDIPMRGHAFEGVSGARLFAPFALEDGRVVVLQRGWVPRGREDRLNVQDRGLQTLLILWRPFAGNPDRTRLFAPVNAPELGIWTYPDPLAMGAHWGLDTVAAGYGELRGPAAAGQGARIEPFRSDLFNAHLEYVATWWSMAGIMALVYFQVWRLRRRRSS